MTNPFRSLASLVLLAAGFASAQWTSLNFPNSQGVSQVVFGRGGSLIAVSMERIFHSPRLGAPWKPSIGLGGTIGKIRAVGDALYVNGGTGFYKSIDYGATWIHHRIGINMDLDILGQAEGKLWAANRDFTGESGREALPLYLSTDEGKTWTPYVKGLDKDRPHTLLTWDGQTVLGTNQGVYRHDATAQAWVPLYRDTSAGIEALVGLPKALYLRTGGPTPIGRLKKGANTLEPIIPETARDTRHIAAYKDLLVHAMDVGTLEFWSDTESKWLASDSRQGTANAFAVSGDTLVMAEERWNFLPGSGGVHVYRHPVIPIIEPVPSAPTVAALEIGATWRYYTLVGRQGMSHNASFTRTIRLVRGNDITPFVFTVDDTGDIPDSSATGAWSVRENGTRTFDVRCAFAAIGLACDDLPANGHLGMARLFGRRPLQESFSGWFMLGDRPMDARVDRTTGLDVVNTEEYVWSDSLGLIKGSYGIAGSDFRSFEETHLLSYNGQYTHVTSITLGLRSRQVRLRPVAGPGRFDALGRLRKHQSPVTYR